VIYAKAAVPKFVLELPAFDAWIVFVAFDDELVIQQIMIEPLLFWKQERPARNMTFWPARLPHANAECNATAALCKYGELLVKETKINFARRWLVHVPITHNPKTLDAEVDETVEAAAPVNPKIQACFDRKTDARFNGARYDGGIFSR
jgi:hypothetical protein